MAMRSKYDAIDIKEILAQDTSDAYLDAKTNQYSTRL